MAGESNCDMDLIARPTSSAFEILPCTKNNCDSPTTHSCAEKPELGGCKAMHSGSEVRTSVFLAGYQKQVKPAY
jgi:hypothetical protein